MILGPLTEEESWDLQETDGDKQKRASRWWRRRVPQQRARSASSGSTTHRAAKQVPPLQQIIFEGII